jgi:hypothetical protein
MFTPRPIPKDDKDEVVREFDWYIYSHAIGGDVDV